MANYSANARTNYFAVKDRAAFDLAIASSGLDCAVWEGTGDNADKVALGFVNSEGGIPVSVWDEAADDFVDIDTIGLVAEHLADGETAVFMQSGAEKMRYVTGFAIAVHSDGRTTRVDLDDIFAKAAAEFGVPVESISDAAY